MSDVLLKEKKYMICRVTNSRLGHVESDRITCIIDPSTGDLDR